MSRTIPPLQLFLRYAVPCAFVLRQRGEIDDVTLARLERAAVGRAKIPRREVERIFFRACRRLDEVAEALKKKRFDTAVIREYFVHRHNRLIDEGADAYANAPKTLRDLCRVERATVTAIHGDFCIMELPNGKHRTVITPFVPDAKVGDALIVHYGYAVERAT